jgi:hypothetical protein
MKWGVLIDFSYNNISLAVGYSLGFTSRAFRFLVF